MIDIAKLRELLEAACIRGDWRVSPSKPPNVQYINQPGCNMVAKLHDAHGGEANAALVCAAINALPELLAIAEAAIALDEVMRIDHGDALCFYDVGNADNAAIAQRLRDALAAARRE